MTYYELTIHTTLLSQGGNRLRTPLILHSKEMHINPFLLGDFLLEEDKRNGLNDSDLETIEDIFIFFCMENNLKKLTALFNEENYEKYERYYDDKHGEGEFKATVKNISEANTNGPVSLIVKAVVNFFFGNNSVKNNTEIFSNEMASAYLKANEEDKEFEGSIRSNIRGQLKRLGY